MKMFRRVALIFVIVTTVALLAVVLSGCFFANEGKTGSDPDHEHTFSTDWRYDYEGHYHAATCGHNIKGDYAEHDLADEPDVRNDGGEFYFCKVCGYEKGFSHDYGEPELIKAAELCTEDSYYRKTCKKCEYVYEYIASSEHDFSEWEALSDDLHSRTCKICNYEDTHAPNPVGVEIIEDRDCTHSGLQKGYCRSCRLDMNIPLPALGHNWDCTSLDGKYHSRSCARCGECDVATHSFLYAMERNGVFHEAFCHDCSIAQVMLHDFSDGDCLCGLSYVPSNGLTYAETDGGLNVVGIGSFSGKYLYIPAEHNGKTVVGIAAGAFSGATSLESVYVPDSVTSIGEGAFSGCDSITGMRLPFIGGQKRESTDLHQYPIGYIFGEYAGGSVQTFYDDSLTETTQKRYDIPRWLRYIAVSGGVLLPGSLKNSDITTVILESGVTAIERDALPIYDQYLTVSDTVTKIADGVLTDSNFKWLHVDENNTHYKITDKCFIDIAQKTVLTARPGCVIPNDGSVTKLGACAFYNSEFWSLIRTQPIVIPSAITYIGEECFRYAKVTVNIESTSLTYIGDNAFRDCTQVQGLTLDSDADVYIGSFALTDIYGAVDINCSNINIEDTAFCSSGITYFTLKSDCATFGNRVFDNCKILLSIRMDCDEAAIGNYFAYYCNKLGSVTIAGLAELGDLPFIGCYGLRSVSLSGDYEELPYGAFNGCTILTSVTLPSNLTKIGNYAFSGCSSLAKIEIPDSVTDIGSCIFDKCSSLSELKIPFLPYGKLGSLFSKTQYTGSYSARQGGYSETYYIPKTLKKISVTRGDLSSAFMNCTSLTEINLGVDGYFSGDMSSDCFSNVGITTLDVPDGLELSSNADFGGMNNLTTVVWRLNTDVAGPYFTNCPKLKTLTIANNVTSIMPNAFYGLSGLNEVNIPDSVTSIGEYALGGSALTELSLPKLDDALGKLFSNVRTTGSVAVTQETADGEAVYYIPKTLVTVTVGGNSIPQGAFMNCSSIQSMTCTGDAIELGDKAFFNTGISQFITPNVFKVGQAAFQNCTKLTEVELGDLTELNAYMFKNCDKLASLVAGLPTNLTAIPNGLFDGCAALTAFDIPSTVNTIGERAFAGCSAITALSIPSAVVAIGEYAFAGTAISDITLPENITAISAGTFDGCALLTAITIPNSVGSIGDNAFSGCASLGTAISGGSLTTIGANAFKDCANLTVATLPGSYTVLSSGVFDGCAKLSNLTIATNISEVESRALANCAKIDTFDFSKLTDIGDEAFIGCTSLTIVTFPTALISIGKAAFSGCTSLTTVRLDCALVTCTATQAEPLFLNCPALSTVEIGSAVSEIPAYMFAGCTGIKSVALTSAALTKIGEGAFMNTGLTSLALDDLADGIIIDRRAFYGCADVASFAMPSGSFTIRDEAFFGMNKLTELAIEYRTNSRIGEGAFGGWSSLAEITTNDVKSGNAAEYFGYIFGKVEYDGATACAQYKNHNVTPTVYYIPDTLKKVTVTGGLLSSGMFSGLSGISEVIISESYNTPYQAYLFSGCTSLKTVTFPEDYYKSTIPEYMFEGCLLPSFDLIGKANQIGKGAFAGSKIKSVNMCSTVDAATSVKINDGAFENCTELTSFTVCGMLQTEIGQSAFAGCSKLETFETRCAKNVTVGISAFGECRALTSLDFSKCEQITLSNNALENCSALTSFDISHCGQIELSNNALENCSALTSLDFSKCQKVVLSDYALKNCSSLSAINLDSATSIGLGALSGCTSITELELNYVGKSANASSISERTVAYMYGSLPYNGGVQTVINTNSYYIPNTLKKITLKRGEFYDYAFQGCVGATEIIFPAQESIPRSAFQDCTSLQSVTFDSAVYYIKNYAFRGCTALSSVTLGDMVYSIGIYAFADCTKLSSVTLDSKLREISSYAFKGCTGLVRITIPAGVRTIGVETFADCTRLINVTFEKTYGWYCTPVASLEKTHLDSKAISNTYTAAYYLTNTYKSYTWTNPQL